MTAVGREQRLKTPPRLLIRTFWMLHRTGHRLSGGRFGLAQPAVGSRFGMMRLVTVGRRSGRERTAIVGYFEDGPNLVTMAMNGWDSAEPAWWLNLQANPDVTIHLAHGSRRVRARAASGQERARLWAQFDEFPGWGDDIGALAARRSSETAVVVFEPRSEVDDRVPIAAPAPAAPTATDGSARWRPRFRHLWIVPGLAIAFYASGQAEHFGLGILPLLVFGIAPDLPRLLAVGQRHQHGQMAARSVPAFNLMHHPGPPVVVLALAVSGVLPPIVHVGALVWLGHIVIGLGIGDRMRRRDGFLEPLWTTGRASGVNAAAAAPAAVRRDRRAARPIQDG